MNNSYTFRARSENIDLFRIMHEAPPFAEVVVVEAPSALGWGGTNGFATFVRSRFISDAERLGVKYPSGWTKIDVEHSVKFGRYQWYEIRPPYQGPRTERQEIEAWVAAVRAARAAVHDVTVTYV